MRPLRETSNGFRTEPGGHNGGRSSYRVVGGGCRRGSGSSSTDASFDRFRLTEKRVNDVIVEAKIAADNARKGAAKLSLWLIATLLFGAFAASLAAVEGDALRDGTWKRTLTPRPI
jgi:hypothetical protein